MCLSSNDKNFFNLYAELVQRAKRYREYNTNDSLDYQSESRYADEVDCILFNCFSNVRTHDKIRVNFQIKNDIINHCENKNSFFFYRAMIAKLDSLVNLEQLIIDYNAVHSAENKTFKALNDNYKETGVRILPYVFRQKTTISFENNNTTPTERKGISDLGNNLIGSINRCYYVNEEDLKGLEVYNTIIDLPNFDKEKGFLKIAATPLTNEPILSLAKVNTYSTTSDSGDELRLFEIKGLNNEKKIEERFRRCYQKAQQLDVDILIAPEILCPSKLFYRDETSLYNQLLNDWQYNHKPYIIAPGSYWENKTNKTPIYFAGGYFLGAQYKLKSFIYEGLIEKTSLLQEYKQKYTEDLSNNTEQSIFLIHIQGWGIIAFPICLDFIEPDTNRILCEYLKANIILCSACSKSLSLFEKASLAAGKSDSNVVYINTCAALDYESSYIPDFIGGVYTPSVSPNGGYKRLQKQCGNKCRSGCLFVIELPLNRTGKSPHWEKEATYEHVFDD